MVRLAAQDHADVHLDRGQRLADLVVQLPCEQPPLLLLDIDKTCGQPLQIFAIQLLASTFAFNTHTSPVTPCPRLRVHARDHTRSPWSRAFFLIRCGGDRRISTNGSR